MAMPYAGKMTYRAVHEALADAFGDRLVQTDCEDAGVGTGEVRVTLCGPVTEADEREVRRIVAYEKPMGIRLNVSIVRVPPPRLVEP